VSGGGRRPPPLLVAPAVATVALLLLPLAYLVIRASEGGGRGFDVLIRGSTLHLLWSTGLLVAGVVAAAVLVAVPLAWLVTRTDLPGRRWWAVAAALPLVVPSYVAALCLLGAFGPRGLAADALGVDRLPDIRGYWGALVALTLSTYPYVFLLTSATLRDLDPSLEEAARGLGLSRGQVFRRVTVPALRPPVAAGGLLVALYVLSDFGVVSLMRYDALTRAIFLQYRSLFDRTPAAVLGLVLVGLTAVVLLLELRGRSDRSFHRTAPGASRRPAPVPLGRWKAPALAFCAAALGVFLVVPVAVLMTWLVRGIERGDVSLPWSQAWGSLTASGAAAIVAMAASLPVALLAVRYPRRWTRGLERASFAANALPGIVIALALVFFAARYAPALYQTFALLVFAYVVRFFPQGLTGTETALLRVPPRMEEASRGLGRGALATTARVTVPLVRPGLLAGGALVFLSAMKELPATLLLRPIGFETLATEIWSLTGVGAYSRAALPALVLIGVSVPVLLILQRDRSEVEQTAAGG
jgi:iron(III) transport system permease protein